MTTVVMTGAPAGASSARTVLAHSKPAWAKDRLGTASPAQTRGVAVRVYLAPRGGERALDAAVAAVSDPTSPQYRQFETPAQYRARFEPTAASAASVAAWLRGAGLIVTGTGAGRRYVAARGDAGALNRAFGVTLGSYRYEGGSYVAPEQDASVPSSVSGEVAGVVGLDNAPAFVSPASAPDGQPPAFQNAHPCSIGYGQIKATDEADGKTPLPQFNGKTLDYAPCGYTPLQLNTAYGVAASGLTGKGATVAIIDAYASPTIEQDTNTYSTTNGWPAFTTGQFNQTRPSGGFRNQSRCGPGGWFGEETLDVEAVHAMAPAANIDYFPARSCSNMDLLDTVGAVVDADTASIVSDSWGGVESKETSGDIAAYEQAFKQGAMEGIGFYFSSGDDGNELLTTGIAQTDYPTSDPSVTSVGGTTAAISAKGSLMWQTGWGTDKYNLNKRGTGWTPIASNPFLYGAGGGFSALFGRPAYQDGVVPASDPPGRAVPDVGLDADPTTGMLEGETQRFPNGTHYGTYRIGGTSVSCPLMAGMMADATQRVHHRIGLANPTIYSLARTNPSDFTDVTPVKIAGNVRPDFVNGVNGNDGIVYSVRTFDDDLGLSTGKGWDDVTGNGSPNAGFLAGF
jgi:subtilase family serine protease